MLMFGVLVIGCLLAALGWDLAGQPTGRRWRRRRRRRAEAATHRRKDPVAPTASRASNPRPPGV